MEQPMPSLASSDISGEVSANVPGPDGPVGNAEEIVEAAGEQPSDDIEIPPPPPPPVPQFSAAEAPKLVDAPTIDSLKVTWPNVVQTGLSGVVPEDTHFPECDIDYALELSEAKDGTAAAVPDEDWLLVYRGTQNAAQIRNLRPGRSYSFRVIAEPLSDVFVDIPAQQPSPVATFATVPTIPCQPEPPVLSARARTSLKFKWAEPEETGGRSIGDYQLDIFPAPGSAKEAEEVQEWLRLFEGPQLAHKAVRLRPGVRYSVRVKAINVIGESVWSKAAAFTTQASVPEQPAAPTPVSATPDSITMQWEPPHDNGDVISQYRLERDNGGGGDFELAYTGPDCSALLGGLQCGVEYRFRLWAFNSQGKSTVSPIASATTAATVPGPPPAPRIVGLDRTAAELKWGSPAADGGSPVTQHQLEMRPKCATAIEAGIPDEWLLVYQGAEAVCNLGNLSAGCTYSMRVRSGNAVGWGPTSPVVDVVTSPEEPGPPKDLEIVNRSQDTIELQWLPPSNNGGAPISGYCLYMARVGAATDPSHYSFSLPPPEDKGKRHAEADLYFSPVYTGAATIAAIDELDPGIEYHFRVHAVNSQGNSAASVTLKATTQAAPPVAPTTPQLAAPAAANALKLMWQSPPARGAPVKGFTLEMAQEPEQEPGIGDPTTRGRNGNASEPVSSPEADMQGLGHCSEVSLHFRAVFHGEGSACQVKSLEPNSRYAFRVRAASDAGSSGWSPVATFSTAAATPAACSPPAATASGFGTLEVDWEPPERDNGAAVSGYMLEFSLMRGRGRLLDAAPVWQAAYSGPDLHCQISGLLAGRQYLLHLRAANARGWGVWSEASIGCTALAPPAAPTVLTFSHRTATSLRAKWEEPDEDNGAPVVLYTLVLRQDGTDTSTFTEAYAGPLTACKVTGLQPGTAYSFRLQAINSEGSSDFGPEFSHSTAKPPPPPPSAVHATASAAGAAASIAVSWEAEASSDSLQQYAVCASFEVEATRTSGGAHSHKQNCSAKLSECTLHGVAPGTDFQVRVRCVGAEGAGHSVWSEPVSVSTPGAAPVEESAANVLSDGAIGPIVAGQASKRDRARRRKAATSEDEVDVRVRGGGSRSLKPPSLKRWATVKRWVRRNRLGVWFRTIMILVLVYLFIVLAWSNYGAAKKLRAKEGRMHL